MVREALKLVLGKLVLLSSLTVYAGEATDKALLAAYKQTGVEKAVNKQIKKLQKKYIPKAAQPYVGTILGAAKTIHENKLEAKFKDLKIIYDYNKQDKYIVNYIWKF